jgi:Arc/MetJ-type ribon-helix-helix transcriptional regulator
MKKTVPVPLNEYELEKIDYLVKIGRYKNRIQAIKAIIKNGIHEEIVLFEDPNSEEEKESRKVLERMLNCPDLNFIIKSNLSAHDMLSQERER